MNSYYEARQHLNLSQYALDIIENDKYTFQAKPSFAQMINRVFELYRDFSNASIENASLRHLEHIRASLADEPDSPAKERIISALIDRYKAELISTANSYPRECPFKVQLNRRNYDYLTEWRDVDGAYDDIPGRFVKAVIEEYARKPLVEREGIVFRNLIDRINTCIESHSLIAITLNNGNRFEVRPYGVVIDQGNNYHYLVGYSRRVREENEHPSSFRISNIKDCEPKGGRSGRITDTQKKELDSKIRTVGVQFLLQDSELIHIRFSKRGKAMYESPANLRPALTKRREDSDGSWGFEFNCTQIQAQYYFFKFGSDAEIISPPELRKEFFEQYSKARSLYG